MILERTEHADKCNKAQDNTGLHNINRQKNPYLPDDLKGRLYACMDYMPKTMQQLYEEIGDANIAEIMTALLQMELDGAVGHNSQKKAFILQLYSIELWQWKNYNKKDYMMR